MSIVVLFQGRSAQQQLCHNLADDDADTEVINFLPLSESETLGLELLKIGNFLAQAAFESLQLKVVS